MEIEDTAKGFKQLQKRYIGWSPALVTLAASDEKRRDEELVEELQVNMIRAAAMDNLAALSASLEEASTSLKSVVSVREDLKFQLQHVKNAKIVAEMIQETKQAFEREDRIDTDLYLGLKDASVAGHKRIQEEMEAKEKEEQEIHARKKKHEEGVYARQAEDWEYACLISDREDEDEKEAKLRVHDEQVSLFCEDKDSMLGAKTKEVLQLEKSLEENETELGKVKTRLEEDVSSTYQKCFEQAQADAAMEAEVLQAQRTRDLQVREREIEELRSQAICQEEEIQELQAEIAEQSKHHRVLASSVLGGAGGEA